MFLAAIEKEAANVYAHPWDDIGYTSLIFGLYLVSHGLLLCLVCLAVILAFKLITRVSVTAYEVARFLLIQPVLLARLVASILAVPLDAVRRRLSR